MLRAIHLKNRKEGSRVAEGRLRVVIAVGRIAWFGSCEAVGEMARGDDDETSVY